MKKFLPKIEISNKRRKNSKPFMTGILIGLFGPLSFLFSFRQRELFYTVVYIITSTIIIFLREFIPSPPVFGKFIIPFINWLVYSDYGPNFVHGTLAFLIARDVKGVNKKNSLKESGKKLKENFRIFSQKLLSSSVYSEKPNEYKTSLDLNKISNEKVKIDSFKDKLEEAKNLFEKELITDDEYKAIKKKILGI